MKKVYYFLFSLVMAFCLGSCSQSIEVQWQEQYDLGVRYLSEDNYKEAIIAFMAAVEIDPKRTETYIGLAETYSAEGKLEQAFSILNRVY